MPSPISSKAFHGSRVPDITKLRSGAPGVGTQKAQIYTSSDARVARSYGDSLYVVDVNFKNPLVYNAGGEFMPQADVDALIERAIRGGHDGVVIQNIREIPGLGNRYNEPNTNMIAFDPDAVTIRGTAKLVADSVVTDPYFHSSSAVANDQITVIETLMRGPTAEQFAGPIEDVAAQLGSSLVSVTEDTAMAAEREATALEDPEKLFVWQTAEDERVCEDVFENSCAPRAGEELLLDEWDVFGQPQGESLICTMYAKGGGSNCRCWLDASGDGGESTVQISDAVAAGTAAADALYAEGD